MTFYSVDTILNQKRLEIQNRLPKNVKFYTPSTNNFQTTLKDQQQALNNCTKYDEWIKQVSSKYGVDKDLIKSVIYAESNFHEKATSKVGAQGLMQLMPKTAQSLGISNPMNPYENILGGTKYLKQLLSKYKGNEKLALAAYNAGSSNVEKYKGIPPFSETKEYIKKVLSKQTQLQNNK